MSMRYAVSAVLTVLTIASSANLNTTAATPNSSSVNTNSGIEGQALIGPTCPVVRPGTDCADRPYQTNITILDRRGQVVTRFQTDASGHFRVPLRPGRYTLRPESPGVLPRAPEQTISVIGRRFTSVRITYDSGIR